MVHLDEITLNDITTVL